MKHGMKANFIVRWYMKRWTKHWFIIPKWAGGRVYRGDEGDKLREIEYKEYTEAAADYLEDLCEYLDL